MTMIGTNPWQRETAKKVIIGADFLTLSEIRDLAASIGHLVYAVKISVLWDECGSGVVREIRKMGFERVWVNLNLHDTPDITAKRAAMVKASGAEILTVHASGGLLMMQAAARHGPANVFVTTILPTLNKKDVEEIHYLPADLAMLCLAEIAKTSGITGLVGTDKEVDFLACRSEFKKLKFIATDIGSPLADKDDHGVTTPKMAILNSADYLVIDSGWIDRTNPIVTLDLIEADLIEARTLLLSKR